MMLNSQPNSGSGEREFESESGHWNFRRVLWTENEGDVDRVFGADHGDQEILAERGDFTTASRSQSAQVQEVGRSQLVRCWAWAILAVACLGMLLGCASIQQPGFSPVASKNGLVNWQYSDKAITSEIIFQRDVAGNLRVLVIKGANLLTITQSGEQWVVTGPIARMPWRGYANEAPLHISSWLALVGAYKAHLELPTGTAAYLFADFRASYEPGVGPLEWMEVIVAATGDRFEVVF